MWQDGRRGLRTLALLCAIGGLLADARAPRADQDEVIYRYVDKTGRPVFVNGLSRVPARYRARARRVDLSQVSLNTELGRGLHQEVEREYERLKAAERAALAGESRCGEVREEGALGWLKRLWAEHGYLVVIGGALLALGIATPFIVRHVPADRWVRVLMVVVPFLGSVALMTYAAARTSGALREGRGAPACRPEAQGAEGIGALQNLREGLRQAKQQRQELERELRR
jgi:hypothetical protein